MRVMYDWFVGRSFRSRKTIAVGAAVYESENETESGHESENENESGSRSGINRIYYWMNGIFILEAKNQSNTD